LSRLLVSVERYKLKANQNFLKLQDELASTENQILTARTRFNETVRPYNNHIKIFQTVFAGMFGFKENHTEAVAGAETPVEVHFKYNTSGFVNDIKKLRFLLKKGFLFKDFER
jgi:LemA protein